MPKLLILNKDGTLVKPRSANDFIQHPSDQELLPGVKDAISKYASDRWVIAIASNQGGCEVRQCKAEDFPIGAYMLLKGTSYHVSKRHAPGGVNVYLYMNGDSDCMACRYDQNVQFQYKTLDMAIAEMHYCLNLLPQISIGLFCPDMEGKYLHMVSGAEDLSRLNQVRTDSTDMYPMCASFRKPNPGMLQAIERWIQRGFPSKVEINSLFVSDRPEDEQAAQNAGIDFMWAEEWRNAAQ